MEVLIFLTQQKDSLDTQQVKKSETYNAKIHRDRIFGLHVDKYMKSLKKDSPEDYKA